VEAELCWADGPDLGWKARLLGDPASMNRGHKSWKQVSNVVAMARPQALSPVGSWRHRLLGVVKFVRHLASR